MARPGPAQRDAVRVDPAHASAATNVVAHKRLQDGQGQAQVVLRDEPPLAGQEAPVPDTLLSLAFDYRNLKSNTLGCPPTGTRLFRLRRTQSAGDRTPKQVLAVSKLLHLQQCGKKTPAKARRPRSHNTPPLRGA